MDDKKTVSKSLSVSWLRLTGTGSSKTIYTEVLLQAASGYPDRINVLEGFVCAMAGHQDELDEHLVELVLMVLDYGMHSDAGLKFEPADTTSFLN